MVQRIRHGPTGHMWLHQSLSVFEECTGPPKRGVGEENLGVAPQCSDSQSQIKRMELDKGSEKLRNKRQLLKNLMLLPYGDM